jgi:hypothetical protein
MMRWKDGEETVAYFKAPIHVEGLRKIINIFRIADPS